MFRPKKRYGQHFLADKSVVREIISRAGFKDPDEVLEIGPGAGALTLPLSKSVRRITAVEKDPKLARFLSKKVFQEGIGNVSIFNEDILKVPFETLMPLNSGKIQVIGNLPYNISSPLLEKLVANRALIKRAVLMFQSEVANRITALPGTKAYGALTLIVGYHCSAKVVLDVSRKAFRPVPKVDSMVVELDFERPLPVEDVSATSFRKVVKGAFYHRRKTIMNSLKHYFPWLDRSSLDKALEQCGINPEKRAESLSMDEFLQLARSLAIEAGGNFD